MKVLEENVEEFDEYVPWSIVLRCNRTYREDGCGSKLEITEDDIMEWVSRDEVYGDDVYYYYYCPVCGRKKEYPEHEIPLSVRVLINQKYNKCNEEYIQKAKEAEEIHKAYVKRIHM